MLTSRQVMELAVKALDSKKVRNIKVLETSSLTVLADYFIICSATSTTHIRTLSDEAGKVLTQAGEPAPRVEGYRGGGWVLMDFGSVIIHLFLDEIRKFYDIEGLWGDASEVDVSSLLTAD